MNKNDETYQYTKIRKNFGRQPMFCEVPVHFLDSIYPDISEQNKYCLQNPVTHEVQASELMKEQYVNTKTITHQKQGMNHVEGGWPSEIPFADEELTSRYRRRTERDDSYSEAILGSYSEFEHFINQNNGINMYNMYFKDMPAVQPVEKNSFRISDAYRDPENRQIASLSWTFEDDPKLVVAYSNKEYPVAGSVNSSLTCFVWDLETSSEPMAEFLPPTACWHATCSPGNPSIICGGLEDGRVCIFDIRAQKEPVQISAVHLAHRDPISALIFMQSRLNLEFFSGSLDGLCMWWDIRNISIPSDALIMSVRIPPGQQINLANSEGVSALQYDRAFPTKFLCGTETGMVINVNRKGKTHDEIMSAIFQAHNGPVKAVHRSPCTSKIFITCGEWVVHIWSEDIHTSPIVIGMPHRHQINDVVWAPQRISSYMSVSADGKFRYWDLLRKDHAPTLVLPISKNPLLKIKPHEEGRLVAIGDAKGVMCIVSLSESLTMSGDNDKPLMLQKYERETRKERILENRVKEIRLKVKTEDEGVGTAQVEIVDEEALLNAVETEYKRIVLEETRLLGITPSVGDRGGHMRQR